MVASRSIALIASGGCVRSSYSISSTLRAPFFQLEAAGLVDFMRPEPPRRKMSCGSARSKRAGLGADHADFDGALVRMRGSDEWRCERGRTRIFQQIASSHGYLPVSVALYFRPSVRIGGLQWHSG